ncbi:MAG: hypothetical protein R6V54_13610, partial [Desulfobacteraceae bacterium]
MGTGDVPGVYPWKVACERQQTIIIRPFSRDPPGFGHGQAGGQLQVNFPYSLKSMKQSINIVIFQQRQRGQACVIVIIYGVFGIIPGREDNDNNAGLTPHMTVY